ncbi:MAG: hypothetical protein LBH98_01500 [Chitinispirillales bacterium]|nr:hypothetical protein [Chitinispirillales bacterium]
MQFIAEIENDWLTKEQQLIFGLAVLNRRYQSLRGEGYSFYLRELLKVTGFNAAEAQEILVKYKDNPEKYITVLEEIKQNLVKNNE